MYGFQVVTKIDQLWSVVESPPGFPPGGHEKMTPRITVKGWSVHPVTGSSGAVERFVLSESLTGHEGEEATIPVSLVYDKFFPTKEHALDAWVKGRIDKRIAQIQSAFNLAITELKAELKSIAGV